MVVRNVGELLTCAPASGGLGVVSGAALAATGDAITWIGPDTDLSGSAAGLIGPATSVLDAGGRVVMPGVVECHTHLVFGGDRAAEYQMRVAGRSYLEIAAAGGGIKSTVAATRAASSDELYERGLRHLAWMASFGVTTVEAKTGYGLSVEDELRVLEIYQKLDREHPLTIVPTLLGAHTVPLEYKERPEAYVDLVVEEMVPAAAARGLARFCDVFVEEGAFSPAQARRVLEAGLAHGMRPKLHADQLSAGGGAELAAELGAVSADHLDHISEAGIAAMAEAGVTGVLLPGAVFFLGLHDFAPARRMIEGGMRIALSTDFNPGTCFSENVFLMGTLASSYLRMTVDEVIPALTYNAACAIAMEDQIGSLEVGKRADVLVLDVESHLAIPYHWGVNPVATVIKDGRVLLERHATNPRVLPSWGADGSPGDKR
ncbi:MAG: imidazolonepropionase [Actinobacteria bacterium]|nr:imidazolonepropionase [Actinomycetota bacterium]